MLGSNQRPPPCRSGKGGSAGVGSCHEKHILQANRRFSETAEILDWRRVSVLRDALRTHFSGCGSVGPVNQSGSSRVGWGRARIWPAEPRRDAPVLHFWHCCVAVVEQNLITVSQAAEALSSSGQSIRNWIREGRLAAVRIGNRFLIPRSEVERLRGDVPATSGESPWDFDEGTPGEPLPRAGERRSVVDSGGELFGG